MKISIITPAYNPGPLILETFRSLKNQTYQNFEWIIVNDCSNDENEYLFNKIKNEANFHVIIITNKINYKQARSKNIGLKHANGKFIKFLDADDLIDINHLENQYNLLKKYGHKNHAVFSPTINFWEKKDKRIEKLNSSYRNVGMNSFDQIKYFLVFPFFSHCGCLFLKQDIVDVNGFDEYLTTDEDGDFILRLMFKGIIFICQDKSYYFYRQHENERVSNNDSIEKWEHRYYVCEKIEKQLVNDFSHLKEQLAQR